MTTQIKNSTLFRRSRSFALVLAVTLAFLMAASHYLDVPDQPHPYPVIPAIHPTPFTS